MMEKDGREKNAGTLEFLKAAKGGRGGRKRLGVEGEYHRKRRMIACCFHGFSISHP